MCSNPRLRGGYRGVHTRGQTLLELLGLVGVLKDKSVDVLRASDLELDVVDLLVLLYAGSCLHVSFDSLTSSISPSSLLSSSPPVFLFPRPRRNCRKRTAGILAPADLDELLDIGDFGRHLG
jgi:hypothetical protein